MNLFKLIRWLRSGMLSTLNWNLTSFKAVAPRNRGGLVMWSPPNMVIFVNFVRFRKFSSGYVDPMWSSKLRLSKLIVLSVRLGAFVLEICNNLRLIRPVKKSLGSSLIPMFSISNCSSERNGLNQDSSITQWRLSLIFKFLILGVFGPSVAGIAFSWFSSKRKSVNAAQGRKALSSIWVILFLLRYRRFTELSPVKLSAPISDILLLPRFKVVMSVGSPAGTTVSFGFWLYKFNPKQGCMYIRHKPANKRRNISQW